MATYRVTGALAVAVLSLSLGLLSLAGCAQPGPGGLAAPAPGPTSPLWITCPSPRPNPTSTLDEIYQISSSLSEVADRVRPIAELFPGVYSGTTIEAECDRIVVYRVPSPDFDAAVRAALPGEPVLIRDAKYSERELSALAERIADDLGYWRARDIEVTSVAPDPTAGVIRVGTKHVHQVQQEFPARYGIAVPFEVTYEEGITFL